MQLACMLLYLAIAILHPVHVHLYASSRYFYPAPSSLTKSNVNQAWTAGTAEAVAECIGCPGYGINLLEVSLQGVAALPSTPSSLTSILCQAASNDRLCFLWHTCRPPIAH